MIFAQTGVQWSELLHLPYFDPTRFVVIDAMHNLFLGLINKHFQDILGIRLEKDLEQDAPVFRLIKYLGQPLNHDLNTEIGLDLWLKRLSNLRLPALELACSELRHHGSESIQTDSHKTSRFTRADYACGILAWARYFFISPPNMHLPTFP